MKYFLIGVVCLAVILIFRRIRLAIMNEAGERNVLREVEPEESSVSTRKSVMPEVDSSKRTVTIEDAVPQITEEELRLMESMASVSEDGQNDKRMFTIYLAYSQRIAKIAHSARTTYLDFKDYPETFTLGDGDGIRFEYKANHWLTCEEKEYFIAWKIPEGRCTKGFRAFELDENGVYPIRMVTDLDRLKRIMQQYYWNSIAAQFLAMDEDELGNEVFDETRQVLHLYSDLEDVKAKACENAGAHEIEDRDGPSYSEYLFLHDMETPDVFHIFEVVYECTAVTDIKYVTDQVEYIKAALAYNEHFYGIDHINI